jgi:hypothetical protein
MSETEILRILVSQGLDKERLRAAYERRFPNRLGHTRSEDLTWFFRFFDESCYQIAKAEASTSSEALGSDLESLAFMTVSILTSGQE